ncbi:MAG TPA: J domain-containing protein [Cryomorphaceae bacterium]|nr:J domain-containing protein [Cryomorphaceae bacterium]
MRFFDKYYRVLHLPPGASDADIKSAYRTLAKKYHPDVSGTTETRGNFIRVNEAYEILMKRDAMVAEAIQRKRKKNADPRRKTATPNNPRARASTHADMKYEEFVKSPLYRTAMVMNNAFDYVFLAAGIIMVIAPIFGYIRDSLKPQKPGLEAEFHFLPIFLGIGFLYGLWYFLFNSKRIKQDQE